MDYNNADMFEDFQPFFNAIGGGRFPPRDPREGPLPGLGLLPRPFPSDPKPGNSIGGAAAYGLCYGRKATKLPTTNQVLKVCKTHGISKMVLPSIDQGGVPILDVVANDEVLSSRMKFVLWVDYKDLASLANKPIAKQWVRKYIEGRESIVSDICVGDVTGYDDFKLTIFKNAMENLKHLLPDTASVKLSAIVNVSILEGCYEAETAPSSCKLTADARKLLSLLHTLNDGQFSLFVCIMPYFMMSENATVDNCLLKEEAQPYMWDGNYSYTQVFDAMLDSICCALSKEHQNLRKADLYVVSGWPTDGPKIEASRKHSKIYIANFVKRFNKRTPRNNKPAGIFIYSLVDEDMIDTTVEEFKHLGAEPYLP